MANRRRGAKSRNFKLVLVAICCLHGVISSSRILDFYRNSWYGYAAADGSPKRVYPAEQIIGVALGALALALSCALFVRNRWLTVLLIAATVGMLVFTLRADDGGGAFDDSGVLSAIGAILTIAWYVPQVVMLFVVLALTWGDHRGLKEIVRSIRIETPGLRGVAGGDHRRPSDRDQLVTEVDNGHASTVDRGGTEA